MKTGSHLCILALSLSLVACMGGNEPDPDVDDEGSGVTSEADASPNPGGGADAAPMADAAPGAPDAGPPPVSFAGSLVPILLARCGGCHLKDVGGSGGLSLGLEGQLAYAALVGAPTSNATCVQLKLVDAESQDPNQSSLYLKLAGTTCGARMPKGVAAVPLSDIELDLFAQWIVAGSPDN
jgi:hypothetical protein